MSGRWNSLWNRLRNKQPDPSLLIDDLGFSMLRQDTVTERVHWSDVLRILAFKRDLLVVDSICLAFQLADETTVEVNEEIEGFLALVSALELRFGIGRGWLWDIALPPFAENLRELWTRDPKDSETSS